MDTASATAISSISNSDVTGVVKTVDIVDIRNFNLNFDISDSDFDMFD